LLKVIELVVDFMLQPGPVPALIDESSSVDPGLRLLRDGRPVGNPAPVRR